MSYIERDPARRRRTSLRAAIGSIGIVSLTTGIAFAVKLWQTTTTNEKISALIIGFFVVVLVGYPIAEWLKKNDSLPKRVVDAAFTHHAAESEHRRAMERDKLGYGLERDKLAFQLAVVRASSAGRVEEAHQRVMDEIKLLKEQARLLKTSNSPVDEWIQELQDLEKLRQYTLDLHEDDDEDEKTEALQRMYHLWDRRQSSSSGGGPTR